MFEWVWLGSIPGIGNLKKLKLIEHFKTPDNVIRLVKNDLLGLEFLAKDDIGKIINAKHKEEAKKKFEVACKKQMKFITILDEIYPEWLKNIYAPPIMLYMKGDLKKDEKMISVVGSRKISDYGKASTNELVHGLVDSGFTIVSGMAKGIDTFAHGFSMKYGGRTIAVLGCGLDVVYPFENKKLMEKIFENGAVLSEFLPGTPPLQKNFPMRNRIISGLSRGVIIIEAGERSGSLITAEFAIEQGRDVFAVPGDIFSPNSKGTNNLIKDGAKIVTCLFDIVDEYSDVKKSSYVMKTNIHMNEEKFEGIEGNEKLIVNSLMNGSMDIDSIHQEVGINIGELNALLTIMEIKGLLKQLPGKIYGLRR